MSESSAFANYSNTTRSLQSGAGQQQQGRTEKDTINDANNFEQQFLIGMAVHQKAKVSELLTKTFKGSKKLQSATGLSEDDLSKIASGDFSGVTGNIAKATSRKLQQKITDFKDAKLSSARAQLDSTSKDQLLKIKQDVSDRLSKKSRTSNEETATAQQNADDAADEVTRLQGLSKGDSAVMRQNANDLKDTATDAQKVSNDAVKEANKYPPTRPTQDSSPDNVRLESNPEYDAAINDAIDKQDIADEAARNAKIASDGADAQESLDGQTATAQGAANDARATLASKTAASDAAQSDADAAAGSAAETATSAESAVLSAENQANKVSKLSSKLSKIDDVDAAAAGESEADPLGLVVAAIGAIVATVIGRKIKTQNHTVVQPDIIQSSYASTIGA